MRLRRLLTSVPVVVGVVLLTASPAFAMVGGSGSHNGQTNQTNTVVKLGGCFKTTGSYTGSGPTSGSTSVSVSDGTNTYTGSISVWWHYAFYQGPDGSFTDSTCTTLGAGAVGSVTSGTIRGTGSVGSLSCTWTNGTYYRLGVTSSSLTIDFPSASGGCNVNGASKVAMHWTNSGGFDQVGGLPHCNGSMTSPPTYCYESFTFTLV